MIDTETILAMDAAAFDAACRARGLAIDVDCRAGLKVNVAAILAMAKQLETLVTPTGEPADVFCLLRPGSPGPGLAGERNARAGR